jgi:hypothetical protein
MIRTSSSRRITLVTLAAGMLQFSQAVEVEFVIDPAQTHVTLSGTAAGLTVAEQGAGSLTTSFEGTVVADIAVDALRFVGGSRIEGVTNGVWSPKAFGEAGTEPADFGAQASGGLITGTAALRELLLDLESETAMPLSQGQFNADGLLFRFPEDAPSAFDYRVTVFIITESDRGLLAGYATNRIAAMGTLTTEENSQVLHVPIEASIVFELLDPGDSTLTITGQLRATRTLEVDPVIVIGSVQFSEGSLRFEWSGAAAQAHRIERTTDLVTWTPVADVPPGVSSWSVEATAGAEFFRVVE